MRHFIFLFLTLAVLLAIPAFAQDGKALYRNNCKVCHDKGSPNKQYTPMTLTQAQWRKFFTTKLTASHANALHPATGKKLFDSLTPDQLKAIQRFCVDHAADSEAPATCG
jgi:cytochrome c5